MTFNFSIVQFACAKKRRTARLPSYQPCNISVQIQDMIKAFVSLTFDGQLDAVNPRPLQRLLVHPAAHLPVVVGRRGNRPVLAAQRHRAVGVGLDVGRDVERALGDPLDGGDRLPVDGVARRHHYRPGAGLDRHRFGRVLRLGWMERNPNEKNDRSDKSWAVNVKRK